MKKLILVSTVLLSIFAFSGCGSTKVVFKQKECKYPTLRHYTEPPVRKVEVKDNYTKKEMLSCVQSNRHLRGIVRKSNTINSIINREYSKK